MTTARAAVLAKFHTVEQLEAMQAAVLAATYARTSVNLHINGTGQPDGRSSSSIELASLAHQEAFLADCEAAIQILGHLAPNPPKAVDFSRRFVRA